MNADKMPKLPKPDVFDPGRFGVAWRAPAVEAYAREYAAQQARELVGSIDALSFVIRAVADGVGFDMETTEFRFKADGNEFGKTSIADILRRADALIARHKEEV